MSNILSTITIMVPPPKPGLDLGDRVTELKKQIKNKGLKETVDHILDGYYSHEDYPDPVIDRKRKRDINIFTKKELRRIVTLEVTSLVYDQCD